MERTVGPGRPALLGKCVVKGADDLGAPGTDPIYGKGRLNVLGAVACKSAKSAKSGKSGKSAK